MPWNASGKLNAMLGFAIDCEQNPSGSNWNNDGARGQERSVRRAKPEGMGKDSVAASLTTAACAKSSIRVG